MENFRLLGLLLKGALLRTAAEVAVGSSMWYCWRTPCLSLLFQVHYYLLDWPQMGRTQERRQTRARIYL